MEAHELAIQRPYWKTLGYDVVITDAGPDLVERPDGGAKLTATFEGKVHVSEHDDLAAMITAAEKLQDRAYGKPTQATEISGPDQEPIGFFDTSDPEVRRLTRELLVRSSNMYEGDPEGAQASIDRLNRVCDRRTSATGARRP